MPQRTATEAIETAADDLAGALCLTAEGFQSMSTEQQKFADAYVHSMEQTLQECDCRSCRCTCDCTVREGPAARIMDNFAARFLPSLVSAYKSWPGICSPYTTTLSFLVDSPYLVKYIRETAQGYTLLSVCAHKMVQHPIPFSKDSYRDGAILHSLSVMYYLLYYAEIFPRHLGTLSNVSRKRLLKWMKKVSARSKIYYNDDSVGGLTQTAYKIMGEVSEQNANSLRNRTAETDLEYVPWLDCGNYRKHCADDPCLEDECFHEDPPMQKTQRKQCSRCKATAYCSKEHQKLDWPRHKLSCFPAEY